MATVNHSSSNDVDPKALEALFKHGIEIFGTEENFVKWLNSKNFFFDKKPPVEFLNTPGGMEYIDNRLTGLEYGDNA
jgi:uncharacterized protein (DUF2384 family)